MRRIGTISIVISLGWGLYSASGVSAQTSPQVLTPTVLTPTATGPSESLISLDFPANLELKVLIQYVGQRLGINFIYDEQTVNQHITMVTPARVSRDSLLGLLESALKMKGLIIVDGDQPGWKKILPVASINTSVIPTTQPIGVIAGAATQPAEVITQVFELHYADVQKSDQIIRPFLTPGGGNSVLVPDQHLLIVSDYSSVISRMAELLKLLDQPPQSVATQFIPLKNIDVTILQPQVQQVLAARDKAQGITSGQTNGGGLELLSDTRTNQLILIGSPEKVDAAHSLASSLDVPLPLLTRVYTLKSMDPDRLDKLVKQLIDPLDAKRLYQSATDKDSGMLIVTTTPAIHQKIADLQQQMDVPVSESASPIRFYKLTNTTAADVLATIRSLEGEQSNQANSSAAESGPVSPAINGQTGSTPSNGQSAVPASPSLQTPTMNPASPVTGQASLATPGYTSGASGNAAAPPSSVPTGSQAILGVHTSRGTITADPNTNTIIIEADPASQKVYESLIRMLDKRRPQVLVEVTLVTLDTSNNFSLGVEVGGESTGKPKIVTFNSFGLSTPNTTTGILSLIAGPGFNGTLLNSDIASVVVQALQTNSRSKVLSAPRILVNDNATGTLSSVAEDPYTSVNASTTVATTSFAGYATAGTTITLTPHISEGDHLQLEYTVSLNSFTGSGSNGVPPPRQTDSVESKITIPDGSTVVVGGLNSSNFSQGRQTLPFLGDIPFLRFLVSQQNKSSGQSTLFVFIRPLILRDDEFADLKYLSEKDVVSAGIPGDFPTSQPLLIR